MADSELLAKLKKIDPGMAQAYVDATKDLPDAAIDKKGIDILLSQALGTKDGTITQEELNALILIIQNRKLATDAAQFLTTMVVNRTIVEALGRGVGTQLKTDDDLGDVFKALDLAGKSANFKSPGTHISYDASKYQAIRKLIKDANILVIAVKDGGFVRGVGKSFALYDMGVDPPTLFLFDGPSASSRTAELAHELTHAVQDFLNDPSPRQYRETDAYVVQALVTTKDLNVAVSKKFPAHDCVEMILDVTTKHTDEDFKAVYESAAEIFGKNPMNNGPTPPNPKGKDKQKQLVKILKALADAEAKPAPGKPAPANSPSVAPKK